ncbi:MAG: hypothetical protein K9J17_11080 [Flavobacteriales bacterium]|nr:hypothetical protein [Flavobacteriales bacterium]
MSLLLGVLLTAVVFRLEAQHAGNTNGNSALNEKISNSIRKGLVFLADTSYTLDYGSYALMHYVERIAGEPIAFDKIEGQKRIAKTYAGKEVEMQFFGRLIGETEQAPTWNDINGLVSQVDSTTLQALWSDRLKPQKKAYYDWLVKISKKGGYELTHALLACQWLEETGYVDGQTDEEFAKTKRYLASEVRAEILSKVSFWGDIEIESVALLLYVGEQSSVKQEWIKAILKAQRADGSWAIDSEQNSSVPHATALAIWALKQYSMSVESHISWIQPEH